MMMAVLLTAATLTLAAFAVVGHPMATATTAAKFAANLKKRSLGLHYVSEEFPTNGVGSTLVRDKRTQEHHITDCMFMTSEEGEFYHKATSIPDGGACGAYIVSEPDQNIEIQFNYLDVACENGGLVAVVDGWELNGQIFPSPQDHPHPVRSRFHEFCGQKRVKQTFTSSQNVALIQYRMPMKGSSFSFNVKFVKNFNPCNVLFQTDDLYTLRNYGKRVNCSASTLYPAVVKIAAIDVGVTPSVGRRIEMETGTVHKCEKRGLDDYAQIGGSAGLDSSSLQVADSVCGLSSMAGKHFDLIACEVTTVRLVSSGAFDNSVTISFKQMNDGDINNFMSVVCLPEDILLEKK